MGLKASKNSPTLAFNLAFCAHPRRCNLLTYDALGTENIGFRSGARCLSSTNIATERFGSGDGSSGWKWDKGGVGMGGKDAGKATEIKESVGKGKDYQVPEFFKYNPYSYFDIETA